MEASIMTNIKELLEYAKKETEHIQVGEGFTLKDLFKGYEWNRIPKRDRHKLGRYFFDYSMESDDLVFSTDNPDRAQGYTKVHLSEEEIRELREESIIDKLKEL